MTGRIFLGISIAILLIVAGIVVPSLLNASSSSSTGLRTEPKVDSLAPDFALTDAVTGESVSLSSYRGNPVWLNFWASWCEGCREEMPLLKSAYALHKDQGLALLGINVQEPRDTARNFIMSNNLDWTFLLDRDGKVTDLYWTPGIPHQVFIGKDGVIAAIHAGVLHESDVERYLALILK
jgi:cytochrome c biogenesis protein CcmG, thiol:disulfide interchange protein DsbE